MTCDECRNRLQELVDDELVARERKAIEAHLSDCQTCTQEYKEVSHFTTSMAQAVRPLRPSAELSSKVLTVYHESREQLKAAPPTAPSHRKPIPTWWWLTGIGILVAAGIAVIFWPGDAGEVGRLAAQARGTRVLTYKAGSWTPAGRSTLRANDRIETVQSGAEPCTLHLSAWGKAVLHVPCMVQIERSGETLVLRLLQQAPGRIDLITKAAPAAGAHRLRVAWGSAWVEVSPAEHNEVLIEPLSGEGGGWTGQLRATAKKGAARLGNTGESQAVGEGFSRVVPQTGECEAAQKTE